MQWPHDLRWWSSQIESLVLEDMDRFINRHMERLEGMADVMGFDISDRHCPLNMEDSIKQNVTDRGKAAIMMRELLYVRRLERIRMKGYQFCREWNRSYKK